MASEEVLEVSSFGTMNRNESGTGKIRAKPLSRPLSHKLYKSNIRQRCITLVHFVFAVSSVFSCEALWLKTFTMRNSPLHATHPNYHMFLALSNTAAVQPNHPVGQNHVSILEVRFSQDMALLLSYHAGESESQVTNICCNLLYMLQALCFTRFLDVCRYDLRQTQT